MGRSATLVTWSDAYCLGMPEIDDQHKVLFDLMNQMWDSIIRRASWDDTLEILTELEMYTISHFGEEETFMRVIAYPEFDRHKKYHEEFVARIASEKKAIQEGGELSLDLLRFLRDWLVNHILVADKDYAGTFRHKKEERQTMLGRFFKKMVLR